MAKAPRMTMATQLVLRAFLADPMAELYGSEIGDAAGLMSGTVHPILGRLGRVRLGGRRPPGRRTTSAPLLPDHRGGRPGRPLRAGAGPPAPTRPTGAASGAGSAMTGAASAPGVTTTARVLVRAATTPL